MSLSPILGAASQVLSLFGSGGSSGATTPASTDPLSIVDSSGKANLSQAAKFFSKLQDLAQGNPAQFKKLTAQISSQLQAEALKATGSAQTFLKDLAIQYQTASQTGSTTALQTGHHHAHAHSLSQAAYNQSAQVTAQSILDQVQSL